MLRNPIKRYSRNALRDPRKPSGGIVIPGRSDCLFLARTVTTTTSGGEALQEDGTAWLTEGGDTVSQEAGESSSSGLVDIIGLSVSDYDLIDPNLRSIFFSDSSTLRDVADAYALALASPLLNAGTLIGSASRGIALYRYDTLNSVKSRALTSFGATFTDKFLTVWVTTTDSESITLPLKSGYTYNFDVDWGDGSDPDTITAYDQTETTHQYDIAGTYIVSITGSLPAWYFNNTGSCAKIYGVYGIGNVGLYTVNSAFWGCSSLTTVDTLGWDTSSVPSFGYFCRACSSLTAIDASGWDTSSATSFYYSFYDCALNQVSVDSILQACVDGNVTGLSLNINAGTSSPPSSVGLANVDILVNNRAWTVTVNS